MAVIMDDGTRYVAHWRYEVKGAINAVKGLTETEVGNKSRYSSICDQTMVGFVVSKGGTFEAHPV
jgi:hypothetical protein